MRQALSAASERLAASPVSATARRDAELLLLYSTGLSRADLLTHPGRALTREQQAAYDAAVARRAQAEPVQYITGVQEFYGLPFRVTPAVLIPRPETEHLVEAAVALANSLEAPGREPELRILDVGTGSGILAIALARYFPAACVTALDISPEALAVARENAGRHGVVERIRFLASDLLAALPEEERRARFDLIVANPPYIPEKEPLEAQVIRYEPHTALFAGADGLAIYQRLVPQAAKALRPGGFLLLEIGYGQRDCVAEMVNANHLAGLRFLADLQGIPRVAMAQKP